MLNEQIETRLKEIDVDVTANVMFGGQQIVVGFGVDSDEFEVNELVKEALTILNSEFGLYYYKHSSGRTYATLWKDE